MEAMPMHHHLLSTSIDWSRHSLIRPRRRQQRACGTNVVPEQMDEAGTRVEVVAGGFLPPQPRATGLHSQAQVDNDDDNQAALPEGIQISAQQIWAGFQRSAQHLRSFFRLHSTAFENFFTEAEKILILAYLIYPNAFSYLLTALGQPIGPVMRREEPSCMGLMAMEHKKRGDGAALGEEIQRRWSNTFRLDCTTLGRPIGPVTRQRSWEAFMGLPMEQIWDDTCAIMACTMAVEAAHRFEYEKVHGKGTFKCRADKPYKLLLKCFLRRIWKAKEGADVSEVLDMVKEMCGVPATTTAAGPDAPAAPCALPLLSRERYWLGDCTDAAERVVDLMDRHGPSCIGELWVCPWYGYFDAGRNDALVYRGCGRSEEDRKLSEKLYGKDNVGWHAVNCIGYRFCGGEMHVLVRDNHDAAANGPKRWVHVEEIDTLHTLTVKPLPAMHLGDR